MDSSAPSLFLFRRPGLTPLETTTVIPMKEGKEENPRIVSVAFLSLIGVFIIVIISQFELAWAAIAVENEGTACRYLYNHIRLIWVRFTSHRSTCFSNFIYHCFSDQCEVLLTRPHCISLYLSLFYSLLPTLKKKSQMANGFLPLSPPPLLPSVLRSRREKFGISTL